MSPGPSHPLFQRFEDALFDPLALRLNASVCENSDVVDVGLLSGDDRIDKAARGDESICLNEGLDSSSPVGWLREMVPFSCIQIVAERSEVLERVGDIVDNGCRMRKIPIDQTDSLRTIPDHVPGTRITVADHLRIRHCRDAPLRVVGRSPPPRCVMHAAEQLRG